MSLAETYLFDRGITRETILGAGIEIDQAPTSKKIKDRLGGEVCPGGVPLSRAASEIIWFSICDQNGLNGQWIARPLPTIAGLKFLTAHNAPSPVYIPAKVWAVANKVDVPLIITEGPVKALACVQAGYSAIGLSGVWCACQKDAQTNKVFLRSELMRDKSGTGIDLRQRKVYVAFDADAAANADVRHASIKRLAARRPYKLNDATINALIRSIDDCADAPLECHIGAAGICRDTFHEWRKIAEAEPGGEHAKQIAKVDLALFRAWRRLHDAAVRHKASEVLFRRHSEFYPSEKVRMDLTSDDMPIAAGNNFTVLLELHPPQAEGQQLEKSFAIQEPSGSRWEWSAEEDKRRRPGDNGELPS